MAKPLAGMTGMYGPMPHDVMDEGALEARAAPGTATSHREYGAQSLGYGGPVPRESAGYRYQVYDGGSNHEFAGWEFSEYGEPWDRTPDVHGAPYPRGIVETAEGGASVNTPAGLEIAGEQMRQLHSKDLGGQIWFTGHAPSGHETPTRYTTERFPAPNDTMQAAVPGQIKGVGGGFAGGGGSYGSGQADTAQGYGVLNSLDEFQRGHSIRRIQHDRMPWDFTATRGEQEVPFYGRHHVRQMRLDGPDSPYFEAGDISRANVPWEGRIGYPTEWQQAPEPATLPASMRPPGSADVWAWE